MVTTRNDTHGAPAPICEDRPRARIFVCDDDDDMRALLADALRSDGYEVLEARDGAETLELVSRMLDSTLEMPDLIVMDVLMPHLSGLGVLTALQGAGLETPVIMMTGFAHSSVVERAKRLGATTVLQKPFDVDDLRSAVFACTRRDSGTHAARRAFG